MAWPIQKTWAFQEGVESAELNLYLRDAMNAVGPHLIVRKAADEPLSSNATLQDDNDLILPLGANEAWEFRCSILVSSTSTADFRFGWNAPSGATLYSYFIWANATGTVQFSDLSGTTFPLGGNTQFIPTTLGAFHTMGTIVNGGTAGNLTLQWAQGTASGTTTVKANSALWGVKLA